MEKKGKFVRMTLVEFTGWLNANRFDRQIGVIQNHHTYIPGYAHFKGNNHIALCESMERSHLERGFAEIAQNLTIFPDGDVVLCRSFNTIPAGIKGTNRNGLCIENLGNFNLGGDVMSDAQRKAIVAVNARLLMRFGLPCDTDHVVYHHWWDLDSGQRTNGSGNTKSCPGTAFFGGNSVAAAQAGFLPLIAAAMGAAANPPAPPQALFQGEVNTPSLRIRDTPGVAGTQLGAVANGARLAIYEVRNGWYRIHPTAQRWVSGRYVAKRE
ncbi:MAG: hypothetical protein H6R13_1544 [Proteobacteria bacterium]|nr:hypothetical protein [Pseudomonadota bacterium]